VGVVHDPHTSMRIISVTGVLTSAALPTVAAAFAEVVDGAPLHLDLTGTLVDDALVLRRTELLIDELEQRRVKLHIVGIDPQHPALADAWRL
jgi:anti-anti-sigma regulatory factor